MALEVGTLWGSHSILAVLLAWNLFSFHFDSGGWLSFFIASHHHQTTRLSQTRLLLRYRYAFCISKFKLHCIFPSFLPLFNWRSCFTVAFGWMWILPLEKKLSYRRAIKRRKKDNFLQGIGFVLCVSTITIIIISQCVVCDRGDAFY